MNLYIIGLGIEEGDISLAAANIIKNCHNVVLRTQNTHAAATIKQLGIAYTTFDNLYESSQNFDTLTKKIVKQISLLLKTGDVCYLVDGAVSEDASSKVLVKKFKNAVIFEGVSKVTSKLAKEGISGGYTAISAYERDLSGAFKLPLIIYDLDSAILASEWKLKLFSFVGEELEVILYINGKRQTLPLYEIDSLDGYDYSTVLIIPKVELSKKERFNFFDLYEIVRILRGENGCPWDRAQTRKSITKSLKEECYELIDAVYKEDDDKICEETGDVLLQTAFYIMFLQESLAYDMGDVLTGICKKLITRHTHVFGSDKAADSEEALNVWVKNKQIEKHYANHTAYLDDVPHTFPASLRAEKVIKRAETFNYSEGDQDLLKNEIENLLAKTNPDKESLKSLAFKVVAYLKAAGVSQEEILEEATNDFISRFQAVETMVKNDGLDMQDLDKVKIDKYRKNS